MSSTITKTKTLTRTPTHMPTRTRPHTLEPIKRDDPRFGNDGHSFEAIEHIVLDDDPNTAFCGADQTGVPWDMGWPPCQACLAAMRPGGLN